MIKPELKKKILEDSLKTLMAEANVPMQVHLKVIEELKKSISDYKNLKSEYESEIQRHKNTQDNFSKFIENTKFIINEYHQELNRRTIEKGEPGKPGKDGQTPTRTELLSLIRPLIPKIEDGKTPTKEELVSIIEPLIPKVEAQDLDMEELSKEIIKIFRKKQLLSIDDIKGARTFVKDGVNYKFEELMHGGGGTSSSITYSADISSQCDGSNTVFTIPTNTSVILLTGTDSPMIYKPTTDFTVSGTILTMTSAVNPPSLGATLIVTYTV